MHEQFTKEQQKKIDRLYRKEKWPIKAIARHMQVSDRRVSAFLRGEQMKEKVKPCSCPCHGQKKPSKAQEPFYGMVKELVGNFNESLFNCAAIAYNTNLDCMLDVLGNKKPKTKKEIKKVQDKRLDNLRNALGAAMFEAALAAMWTLPPFLKKLWIESIEKEPRNALKKGKE